MNTIKEAIEEGVLVVISTQCHHGTVSDVYATGRFLTEMGCILAEDMTMECLFAKLAYLIGKVNLLLNCSLMLNQFSHSPITLANCAFFISIGVFNGTN